MAFENLDIEKQENPIKIPVTSIAFKNGSELS